MAFISNQVRNEVKKHNDAIVIGAIVGAVAAGYAISQGIVDLNAIAQAGKSLLDTALGRNAEVTQIAQMKLYGAFIVVGGVAGYLGSKILEMLGFKRKMRRRK